MLTPAANYLISCNKWYAPQSVSVYAGGQQLSSVKVSKNARLLWLLRWICVHAGGLRRPGVPGGSDHMVIARDRCTGVCWATLNPSVHPDRQLNAATSFGRFCARTAAGPGGNCVWCAAARAQRDRDGRPAARRQIPRGLPARIHCQSSLAPPVGTPESSRSAIFDRPKPNEPFHIRKVNIRKVP